MFILEKGSPLYSVFLKSFTFHCSWDKALVIWMVSFDIFCLPPKVSRSRLGSRSSSLSRRRANRHDIDTDCPSTSCLVCQYITKNCKTCCEQLISFSIWDHQNHETRDSIRINPLWVCSVYSLTMVISSIVGVYTFMISLYAQYQYSGWASSWCQTSSHPILDNSERQIPSKWAWLVNCYTTFLPTEGWPVPVISVIFDHVTYYGYEYATFWDWESPLSYSRYICILIAYTSIFQGVNRWHLGCFYTFHYDSTGTPVEEQGTGDCYLRGWP